ncbi:hypothetical protein NPIL_667631 [Nephila pilipes]|uniref:Uncharacterized protein n=1 Tax=Nephila pilipes TaxID=299642 RepID=A0A8X6UGR5_NEPPI|nr:hypothetical protein NPIL_667631 [Nephila pilipes]
MHSAFDKISILSTSSCGEEYKLPATPRQPNQNQRDRQSRIKAGCRLLYSGWPAGWLAVASIATYAGCRQTDKKDARQMRRQHLRQYAAGTTKTAEDAEQGQAKQIQTEKVDKWGEDTKTTQLTRGEEASKIQRVQRERFSAGAPEGEREAILKDGSKEAIHIS